MKIFHEIVAVRFRENAGGRDRSINAIALDDALMFGTAIFREPVAIDQEEAWTSLQLVERKMHSLERRFENVDPVYFFVINLRHAVRDGVVLNENTKLVAGFFFNLLR